MSRKSIMRPRTRNRNYNSFKRYIQRMKKHANPKMKLKSNAVQVIDDCVHELVRQIGKEAQLLCKTADRSTLFAEDIQSAMHMLFPHQFQSVAAASNRAVHNFEASMGQKHQQSMRHQRSMRHMESDSHMADGGRSRNRFNSSYKMEHSRTKNSKNENYAYIKVPKGQISCIIVPICQCEH